MRNMVVVLLAVFASLLGFGSAHMPPLSDLRFPYGEHNGDSYLNKGANPATMMNMPELYFLYGGIFCDLFVTDSGFVSFGKPISYADPQTFPVTTGAYQLQKTALVAAYWSDVDIRCGGAVYYRMTKDPATLVDIGSVVKELGTTASQSFIPKEALIVTYYEVAKLSVPCDPTTGNTFQLVIVTDGVGNSFAVQHYLKLSWDTGVIPSPGRGPATAGRNAGDGKRGYNLVSSTGKITDLIHLTNIDRAGLFVFDLNSGYSGYACSSVPCPSGSKCQVYEPTGETFCSPSCCLNNGGCPEGNKCYLNPDQCAKDPCPPKVACYPTSVKAEWNPEPNKPNYRYTDYRRRFRR